jgi:hypothetical protein
MLLRVTENIKNGFSLLPQKLRMTNDIVSIPKRSDFLDLIYKPLLGLNQ